MIVEYRAERDDIKIHHGEAKFCFYIFIYFLIIPDVLNYADAKAFISMWNAISFH